MLKNMRWIWFMLLLFCQAGLFVPAVHAEQPFEAYGDDLEALYGDEETVSIATGSTKPIYKAPAVASVITAEQIKAMGARTLDEALEIVPGLHVMPSGLSRLDSDYAIRGIRANRTPQLLMLVNGVPLQYAYSGSRPIQMHLPVSSIERIEVLRGPGSAVYGADAFSGVINIITKSAEDIDGTEVGARYGSFDSKDVWLQHGGQLGELSIMFSSEWQKSAGDQGRKIRSDLQSTFDSLFDTDASKAPGSLDSNYDVLDLHLELQKGNWTLHNWFWRNDDAGVGPGVAQALDPKGFDDSMTYMADLNWQDDDLVQDWELAGKLSYFYYKGETEFTIFPPGAIIPIGSDGNVASFAPVTPTLFPDGVIGNPVAIDHHYGLDLSATYLALPEHRIRIGAGIRHQDEDTEEVKNFGPGVDLGVVTDVTGTPNVYMKPTDRTLWYLTLQDEWQFAPDWELTAGVRYDHYSDFGSTVNPRIALVWATRYNLTSKLLYGRAFRAPSFGEQFLKNNPVVLGNPNLDPETIDTVELAFDYRPSFDIQTNLSLFGYRANGLIEYVPDANGVSKTAQNVRDQIGYGFELEANWQATDRVNILGNYAWQHAEDPETDRRIANVPGQLLTVAVDWNFWSAWWLRPQVNYIANRHRADGDPRSDIDDYTLVDLTVRGVDLLDNLELTLAARNLFDEDAREPSDGRIADDYPLEGRSCWAGISYRF